MISRKPFTPVYFQLMPTTKLVDPLTTEQQAPHQCSRSASLSLPDIEICINYVNWVRSDPLNDHLPYGFTIEKKEDWLKTYKEEGYAELKRSFLKRGHPAQNWIYVNTDKKDTLLNYILLLNDFCLYVNQACNIFSYLTVQVISIRRVSQAAILMLRLSHPAAVQPTVFS